MKKNNLQCAICGSKVVHDDITNNLICTECNATHEVKLSDVGKKKFHYRLTKIRILIAVLITLYALYFFLRRIIYYS